METHSAAHVNSCPKETGDFPDDFSSEKIFVPSGEISLTVIENANGLAGKIFSLGTDGRLRKTASAQIYEGTARTVSVESLDAFLDLLQSLKPSEGVCYGVTGRETAKVVTQEQLKKNTVAIARDRSHFRFAEGKPGILMLDFDVIEAEPGRGFAELDAILVEVMPAIGQVQRLWRASLSSFIYDRDGRELIGAGGCRCYVGVDDASAIPMIGARIYQALWEHGHGRIVISRSGQMLDRSLIDASVFQPERIDFVSGPTLRDGLTRGAPEPMIMPGAAFLRSGECVAEITLEEWRRSSPKLREARKLRRPQAEQQKKRFIAERLAAAKSSSSTLSEDRHRDILEQAIEHRTLMADFPLITADGQQVTVRDLLRDRGRYHGTRFADPLEPDYRNDARIAVAHLVGNRPTLYSHAHGGCSYRLTAELAEIMIVKGEMPRAVDEALAIVRSQLEMFERGGELFRVVNDGLYPVSDVFLADYLGRHIRFLRTVNRNGQLFIERCDTPPRLCTVIVEKRGERDLAEIRGVISAPTLRPDGTILSTPGYDPATKLLLRGDAFGTVHECPSRAQLEEAFRTLWKPFAEFPFVAAQDRGVALAAILTALVRRTLGKCPGFSFDAPAAGTGKTLLGQCILRLAGCLPEVVPQCEEEEEIKKQLLSVLREGVGGILFDNIRGVYGSAALEAFLTGEIYKDRVLGLSAMFAGEPNILVLFSGNNFLPKGDLWRRILTARMDAKCADPERRAFDLKPLEYVRQHRQELVAAGLTLMRGFIVESRPRFTPDSLGSFEGWDDLIRQCVIWLGQQGIADVADPALVIATAKEREPERQKLKALLSGAYLLFDTSKWRVGELIKTAEGRQDDELLETLQEIAGERGKVNPRILGRWIERNSDVRCGNMRLVRCDQKSTKPAQWRIEVERAEEMFDAEFDEACA